jgi:hypothetical protein
MSLCSHCETFGLAQGISAKLLPLKLADYAAPASPCNNHFHNLWKTGYV